MSATNKGPVCCTVPIGPPQTDGAESTDGAPFTDGAVGILGDGSMTSDGLEPFLEPLFRSRRQDWW